MFVCLFVWFVGWLVVCLFVCLVSSLVVCLVGWLVGLFVCLFGWLIGRLVVDHRTQLIRSIQSRSKSSPCSQVRTHLVTFQHSPLNLLLNFV